MRRNSAVLYAVQTQRKDISVAGGRNGIGTRDLLAIDLFHHRNELPWSKVQGLQFRNLELEVTDLRREFFPCDEFSFQSPHCSYYKRMLGARSSTPVSGVICRRKSRNIRPFGFPF